MFFLIDNIFDTVWFKLSLIRYLLLNMRTNVWPNT